MGIYKFCINYQLKNRKKKMLRNKKKMKLLKVKYIEYI